MNGWGEGMEIPRVSKKYKVEVYFQAKKKGILVLGIKIYLRSVTILCSFWGWRFVLKFPWMVKYKT